MSVPSRVVIERRRRRRYRRHQTPTARLLPILTNLTQRLIVSTPPSTTYVSTATQCNLPVECVSPPTPVVPKLVLLRVYDHQRRPTDLFVPASALQAATEVPTPLTANTHVLTNELQRLSVSDHHPTTNLVDLTGYDSDTGYIMPPDACSDIDMD